MGFFSSPADYVVSYNGDTPVWISKCEQVGSAAQGRSLRTTGNQNQTTIWKPTEPTGLARTPCVRNACAAHLGDRGGPAQLVRWKMFPGPLAKPLFQKAWECVNIWCRGPGCMGHCRTLILESKRSVCSGYLWRWGQQGRTEKNPYHCYMLAAIRNGLLVLRTPQPEFVLSLWAFSSFFSLLPTQRYF